MKPYIEYKDERLELDANFKLQKEFRKEYQAVLRANTNDDLLDNYDTNEIKRMEKEIKELENSGLTEDEMTSKIIELRKKYPMLKTINAYDKKEKLDELYEKYVKRIINAKYPHVVFDELGEEIVNEKGFTYYYALMEAIIKSVFSSVVNEAPHQKPSFAWDNKSQVN